MTQLWSLEFVVQLSENLGWPDVLLVRTDTALAKLCRHPHVWKVLARQDNLAWKGPSWRATFLNARLERATEQLAAAVRKRVLHDHREEQSLQNVHTWRNEFGRAAERRKFLQRAASDDEEVAEILQGPVLHWVDESESQLRSEVNNFE